MRSTVKMWATLTAVVVGTVFGSISVGRADPPTVPCPCSGIDDLAAAIALAPGAFGDFECVSGRNPQSRFKVLDWGTAGARRSAGGA